MLYNFFKTILKMSEFKHSIVLFTGDDGLPLEFNVRNTNEKSRLKALIEHGGGFCTQNENSVHLISPGTKVLNADLGKKLVSTSYIYDCVKQNYLLDVNDYVFTITEAQTSDISDEDSERLLAQRQSTCKSPVKKVSAMNMEISPIKRPNVSDETTPSNLTLPSSNSAVPPVNNSSESFVEGSPDVSTSHRITSHVYYGNAGIAANERIKSSDGLRENSEDFNPSQSIVSLSKQTDVLSYNVKNLHLPLRQTDPVVDSARNAQQFHSPSKEIKAVVDSARNRLPLHSPSKGTELLADDVRSPLKFSSPSKPLHPTSPRNIQKNIFSSPKKKVDISPIMRVDTKKINRDHLRQCSESSVRNPFQVLPENVPLEKELEENSEKEVNDMDDVSECENQILPPAVQNPGICFENTSQPSEKNAMNTSAAVVSSSQPEDELDNFDNMLLSKALRKPRSEDGETSSQTCTVSSSADAQVTSKPCSAENNTPPLQATNSDNLPDSPNSIELNEEEYMTNLEAEVEEILQKSAPQTLQEKTTLVKYLCLVRKLTPRTVLESLLSNDDFLEL